MSENRRLFLCEDHPESYNGYVRALNLYGYTVPFGAMSVAEALVIVPQLVQSPVLAALLDKEFPDGQGDQIATAIHALNLGIHVIGIGGVHEVVGAEINIFKGQSPMVLLDYLAGLK